ncbi:MAG: hypothetical protein AB7L94_24455 [Kofleriaceae bacterium]
MQSRIVFTALVLALTTGSALAQDAFEVCKGESKMAVAGTGKPSIAMVYLNDFPVTTTPKMRNAVAAQIATFEKAKIVPAKDVEAAKKLVDEKKWDDKSEACGQAPSLVAALGQKHPNLSTGTVTVDCEGDSCVLNVDLERHGRHSKDRWVRYTAPLKVAKDKIKVATIQGAKLKANGVPPDAPKAGLEVGELAPGTVTVRSDVDGTLESDRIMENNPAFAACSPKSGKKVMRGFWAQWKLSAKGNPFQIQVKPFAGRDPLDAQAAECLKKALEATQLRCPRDGKVVDVKTAICL